MSTQSGGTTMHLAFKSNDSAQQNSKKHLDKNRTVQRPHSSVSFDIVRDKGGCGECQSGIY
jgi:hypothetical protein